MESEKSLSSMELRRQGDKIFAISLRPLDEVFNLNMYRNIKTLIHGYKDVFLEKLYNELPLFCSKKFPIELVLALSPRQEAHISYVSAGAQ